VRAWRDHHGKTFQSDVASEAGVSQGTLYYYVESKEALFHLLLERGLAADLPAPLAFPLKSPPPDVLAQRMKDAIAEHFALPRLDEALARRRVTDAREELTNVLQELVDRTFATREAADVLERSARDVPELAAVFYGQVRRSILDRLTQLITKRVAAGHYRRTRPPIAARVLLESVATFARHIYHDAHPPDFDLPDAPAVMIDILVAGMVADRK
jgi:AcrR family transcriptional regulator